MDTNGTAIGLTLGLIFTASMAYALALQTGPGQRLAKEKTHYSVVIGTALVLVPLLIVLNFVDWLVVIAAFAVAGIPIVVRYDSLRAYRRHQKDVGRDSPERVDDHDRTV